MNIVKNKHYPLKIQLLFYRKNDIIFDFINIAQTVQYMMEKYKWIPKDDIHHLLVYPPYRSPYYIIDKINPGVKITVL
jgi:hypothetical protein